jgi:hypothetical protein
VIKVCQWNTCVANNHGYVPLVFQLYRGGQFYWWRKPEYPGKASDLPQKEFEDTKGYYNPYIEQEQTTQWLKEKVQKDKQRSTKHAHKTKDGDIAEILLKVKHPCPNHNPKLLFDLTI